MPNIIIASPEPETQELATLAFELDGWTVLSLQESTKVEAQVALFDIPDREQIVEVTESEPAARFEGHALIVLPRGMDPESARRAMGESYHFIRRPFEIMGVVRLARELTEESAPKKKAVPRRPARPSHTPARKIAKAAAPAKKRPRKSS